MNCSYTDYLKYIYIRLLPKYALTRFAGYLANVKNTVVKNYLIQRFIRVYNVNMLEAREENPKNYACFNDFFIRHLKLEKRPTANALIVSPVDGSISEIGTITQEKMLQAKGHYYSVHQLLATDKAYSSLFENGSFVTLYLSPKDYHRVHMPIEATLKKMIYVPGSLFSVQPATARMVPNLFARNERLVVLFDTNIGPMAMVLVGATIVGSIGTSWHGDVKRSKQLTTFEYPTPIKLKQKDEMGYFKLGSTVILLFAKESQMQWNPLLTPQLDIHLGEALGDIGH